MINQESCQDIRQWNVNNKGRQDDHVKNIERFEKDQLQPFLTGMFYVIVVRHVFPEKHIEVEKEHPKDRIDHVQ